MARRNNSYFFGLVLLGLLCAFPAKAEEKEALAPNSLVKLHVTYQEYEPASPWKKRKAKSRSGYGCVLPGRRILTTADITRDATLIRVEKNTANEYYTGRVEVRDYDVDLSLVTVEDADFFSDLVPVEPEEKVRIDQSVKFLLFEDSKQIRAVPGKIVKIDVEKYFFGWSYYLLYGAAVNFEDRGGGWSEPVFSGGRLIGLTMSYSGEKQYAKIVPASIINRFLGAIRGEEYLGFTYPGFWHSTLRNPNFKEYLGLPPGEEGIYIRTVFPGGSAAGALRKGDVLLSVDGFQLDVEGYYNHPEWGKLDYQDIFTRYYYPGDVIEVEIFREGRPRKEKVRLKRFERSDYLIPIYSHDTQPPHLIVGGLIIQELSVDYLKTWGKKWSKRGNKKFLYYYNYLVRKPTPARERLVILNKVIPAEINVGYQGMRDLVIAAVNGKPISKIEDVVEALKTPEAGFHRFRMEEYNQEIILPVEGLAGANRRIAEEYGLDKLTNVEP